MEQIIKQTSGMNQEGTATHSGWTQFYAAFSKYRSECIDFGRSVMGNDLNSAINSLKAYHASIYSMAQQMFSFYDEDSEEEITREWLKIGEEVDEYLSFISDKEFRSQMDAEGVSGISIELKVKLLKFFNKVDRMAAKAGLLVGQEESIGKSIKRGSIGLKKALKEIEQ